MKPVWTVLVIIGILSGSIQVKEFIAGGYIPTKAAIQAAFGFVDANINRQPAPLEGLDSDQN